MPPPIHVPIGYVPALTRIVAVPEDIDVLFYGAMTDRRRAILDKLRAKGFRVESLFGVYGAGRDAWIARSKIVINIHYSEQAKIFEIVRISYLLANRRAVVSERGTDPTEERDLRAGHRHRRVRRTGRSLRGAPRDDRARRELAERGYQAFSARNQAAILDRALSSGLDSGMHIS